MIMIIAYFVIGLRLSIKTFSLLNPLCKKTATKNLIMLPAVIWELSLSVEQNQSRKRVCLLI